MCGKLIPFPNKYSQPLNLDQLTHTFSELIEKAEDSQELEEAIAWLDVQIKNQ